MSKSSGVSDKLKVDDRLEEGFADALQHKLTDEDIARARELLGVYSPLRQQELYSVATADAIRNWAQGIGDDNPLFLDPAYGEKTRWGAQIGHGTLVGHIKTPMLGDPLPDEMKKLSKGLFRGVHVFVSGGRWEWFRPLYAGDRLFVYSGEESLEEKTSEFADRSVIRVRKDVTLNQRGEVVGIYRILSVYAERGKSRKKGKYADIEAASYTDDDYARIDEIYANERVQGAEKRYFEDVQIGDEMCPMVKGPLTVTEIIAFHAGGYGFVPYGLRSSRLGYKNRKRIAPFYIKNQQGIWDVAQRLHWDSEWAKAIGNPMAYDYGVMRQAWFNHMVSDWAGDDAFIEAMEDSIRKFNYMGDTQFLSGKVVGKREVDGRCLVDLDMRMVSQRDVETAYATATVSLPSREQGLPPLPPVPVELQREAARMFARHTELSAK
ncbi:FAS1-like dehydratase domain-containing protein [Haliea salexigens]|jgi:acyl dehydratase|uniref:FAS1-like dehydratase domain-containing protein n=1 Tax=Haliea salexigens TaxID=287487 RepID=UPI0004006DB4|nr:MaoC family dehydratase N-terminal domain-containing protein [Haliea salexigens]|tara:strand:- start:16556 stop:17863 length:1308 start_codon:yes stop_codon:yes gene_type:complete